MYAFPVNQTGFISISLVDIENFGKIKGLQQDLVLAIPFRKAEIGNMISLTSCLICHRIKLWELDRFAGVLYRKSYCEDSKFKYVC